MFSSDKINKMLFTSQQYAEMHFVYGLCNGRALRDVLQDFIVNVARTGNTIPIIVFLFGYITHMLLEGYLESQ